MEEMKPIVLKKTSILIEKIHYLSNFWQFRPITVSMRQESIVCLLKNFSKIAVAD